MKRIIALLLIGMLVFSFAACGPDEPAAATEALTEAAADETSATAQAETSAIAETEETAEGGTIIAAEQTSAPVLKAPTGQANILALYNESLVKTKGLGRTAYSRKLLVSKAVILFEGLGDVDMIPNMKEKDINYSDNQRRAHDLVSLNDANVKSAALKKQEGNLATYEILLQPASADPSMKSGNGGYFSLVLFSDVMALLETYSTQDTPFAENTTIQSFSMDQGKLLATIDLESGQMQSVEGSYAEDVNGTMKVSFLSAKLILRYDIKAAYKA